MSAEAVTEIVTKGGRGRRAKKPVEITDDNVNVFANPQAAMTEGSPENLLAVQGNYNELADDDVDQTSIEEYENLRQEIQVDMKNIDETYWKVSQKIAFVHDNKVYKKWGYNTFEEYMNKEHNKDRRSGIYIVKIFNYFTNEIPTKIDKADLVYEIQQRARRLPWTKARLVAAANIMDANNAIDVLTKAETLTYKELEVVLKTAYEAMSEQEKIEAGEDNQIKNVRLSFSFPLGQYQTVVDALALAEKIAPDSNKSTQIHWICRDFLTTNPASQGQPYNLADYLAHKERELGITLVAIDPTVGRIIYGEKELENLAKSVPADEVESIGAM